MTLTLAETLRVVEELNENLVPGGIQKVHQPTDASVVLQVRVPGETHHVYLCAELSLARVHLLTMPPVNPPAPPQFCMLLRKHLIGGTVVSCALIGDDRIVRIDIDARSPQGPPQRRSLIVELLPGHENIILLDDSEHILGALHTSVSKEGRDILPRRTYTPPPAIKAGDAAAIDRFEEELRRKKLPNYSAAVELAYASKDISGQVEELRRGLQTSLNKLEKRLRRRVDHIKTDYEATSRSDEFRLKGELLKANLHAIPRGSETVEISDPENPDSSVVIELDSAQSPLNNMQHYFKRARKLRDGRAIIEKRLASAEAELEGVLELRQQLEAAQTLDELHAVRDMLGTHGVRKPPKPRTEEARSQPREFTSADGLSIFVGRNPRQNDELTKSAGAHDYWLHVQHYPGSHVIIKQPRGKPLMKETLLDAAHLAMHFSKLREASKAPIDYVEVKHVRKPRKAAPGFVIYTQQKTIHLVPDKRRLERLLKGREQD